MRSHQVVSGRLSDNKRVQVIHISQLCQLPGTDRTGFFTNSCQQPDSPFQGTFCSFSLTMAATAATNPAFISLAPRP